jgi:hypothetical protein
MVGLSEPGWDERVEDRVSPKMGWFMAERHP